MADAPWRPARPFSHPLLDLKRLTTNSWTRLPPPCPSAPQPSSLPPLTRLLNVALYLTFAPLLLRDTFDLSAHGSQRRRHTLDIATLLADRR